MLVQPDTLSLLLHAGTANAPMPNSDPHAHMPRPPQYGWCMSYCMLVEVNTWLLIAKRTLKLWVLEALFYISWVLLRNIFYP